MAENATSARLTALSKRLCFLLRHRENRVREALARRLAPSSTSQQEREQLEDEKRNEAFGSLEAAQTVFEEAIMGGGEPREQQPEEAAADSIPFTDIASFRGGYFRLSELLTLRSMRGFLREEVERVVAESRSFRPPHERRFEIVPTLFGPDANASGGPFVRATYAHSFDIDATREAGAEAVAEALDDKEDTDVDGEETRKTRKRVQRVPTLSQLCYSKVAENITSYDGIGNVGDPFVLSELWSVVRARRRLTNPVVKSFAVSDTQSLDLSGAGAAITEGTLRHIARTCKGLWVLNLSGALAVNDAMLSTIAKNCRGLRRLDVSRCVNLRDGGLKAVAKYCRDLEEINLEDLPLVTPAALQELTGKLKKLAPLQHRARFNFRTSNCRAFEAGNCRNGDACRYFHPGVHEESSRQNPSPTHSCGDDVRDRRENRSAAASAAHNDVATNAGGAANDGGWDAPAPASAWGWDAPVEEPTW